MSSGKFSEVLECSRLFWSVLQSFRILKRSQNSGKFSSDFSRILAVNTDRVTLFADNPCSSELGGRLGCIHFLIRPMKLNEKSDDVKLDGESNPSHEFVAIRMRDVAEFNGAVAHALSQTVKNETNLIEKVKKISGTSLRRSRLLRGIRRLSDEELFNCLKSSSLNHHGDSRE